MEAHYNKKGVCTSILSEKMNNDKGTFLSGLPISMTSNFSRRDRCEDNRVAYRTICVHVIAITTQAQCRYCTITNRALFYVPQDFKHFHLGFCFSFVLIYMAETKSDKFAAPKIKINLPHHNFQTSNCIFQMRIITM